jgi:hypothetical protein
MKKKGKQQKHIITHPKNLRPSQSSAISTTPPQIRKKITRG